MLNFGTGLVVGIVVTLMLVWLLLTVTATEAREARDQEQMDELTGRPWPHVVKHASTQNE